MRLRMSGLSVRFSFLFLKPDYYLKVPVDVWGSFKMCLSFHSQLALIDRSSGEVFRHVRYSNF